MEIILNTKTRLTGHVTYLPEKSIDFRRYLSILGCGIAVLLSAHPYRSKTANWKRNWKEMEVCLKLLPRKCYDKNSLLVLMIFVSIGVVVIGVAGIFEAKATLQCNPDKKIASDVSTRKYIDTQCFLKYTQEFYTLLPIYVLVLMNFGIVCLLSIIYAHLVKHRVEIFTEPSSATANDAEEGSQQLLAGITVAGADPTAHRKSAGRYFVFPAYVTHLIVCRIIPLIVFAVLLLSSNFPVQFQCHMPTKTTSIPLANFTQNATFSIVDCTYPMGSNNEILAATVATVNFVVGTLAFVELVYLLHSAWKDHNLFTDLEFCRVYLRKRKKIRKLLRIIREKIPKDLFQMYDDFGGENLSYRKLEEMYINVIIQEGRAISKRKFKDRHETYEAYFKAQVNATRLENMADLFKRKSTDDSKSWKSVLVVGRPGIGKTRLTEMMLYHWQQQESKFWHGKIVILIRFRRFNTGKISLKNMLRKSDGLDGTNISADDFTGIYEYICLEPSKVVLIFDGLDELKVDDRTLTTKECVNNNNEETHIYHIWKQLVRDELLPGATVLTTSRPTAERLYKPTNNDSIQYYREVEILGFHEEEVKNYVKKFCGTDKQKSTEIWNLIKDSPELLSLCYIPVSSYIICLTLGESIKMEREEVEGQRNVPRTITELYKRAINILLFRHHLEYKDKETPKNYITAKLPKELQDDLNKLKAIARKGMMEEKLIFYHDDDPGISDCGLFNKLEDKEQNIFCFLHLTIQEFLAALDVVDDMDNVESFLSEHIENPKWHLVILFVSGLIGDKFRKMELQRYTKFVFEIF